jgi:uncharacterized membrane protein
VPARRVTLCLPLLLLVSLAAIHLAGCNSGDATLAQVDPGAVPQNPDYDSVFGIIQRECAPCHTESDDDGPEDAGAWAGEGPRPAALGGVEPDLTTCEGILSALSGVDEEIRENTMPPGAWPRLSSEEKLTIERWIDNGAVAPCN